MDVPETTLTQESLPSSRHLPLTLEELKVRLMVTEKRFRRACDQVAVVDRKIQALEHRYFKARTEERRSYRYILRMRLMTTENVRDLFYMYAAAKADEVMALRKQLGEAWEEQQDDVTDFVDNNASDSEDDDEEMDVEEEEEEEEETITDSNAQQTISTQDVSIS